MKVACCIPIKMNNERLPGKNTRPLGGKPLIQYILNTVSRCGAIDNTYVFCSDESIKDILPDPGIFLSRPPFLDEAESNFTQIFKEFSSRVDAEIYVYTHATAPFVRKETIEECIKMVDSGEYDSAFTASIIQDFLWQDGRPLNFDAGQIPRSQDIKPVYRETSGIYVFRKKVFAEYGRRIGFTPYIKAVSYKEAVDINNIEDFLLAENLLHFNEEEII